MIAYTHLRTSPGQAEALTDTDDLGTTAPYPTP